MLNIAQSIISGSLVVFILLAAALAGAFVYILIAIYPREERRLKLVNVLLGCSLIPLCVILLLSALVLLPSFANELGLVAEHCHQLATGNSLDCAPHRPVPLHNILGWWISILVAGVFLRFLFLLSNDFDAIAEILRSLEISTKYRLAGDVDVVESKRPLAITAGYPRSRIFLSSYLVENLSTAQLAVVLAHERAHIRRHDIVKTLVARTLSILHFPAVRRWLLRDLSLAIEHACDEHTTRTIGNRAYVADTILSVERLFARCRRQHAGAFSVAGSNIPSRIEMLLAGRRLAARHWRPAVFGIFVVCLVIFATADPLHHFIEIGFAWR